MNYKTNIDKYFNEIVKYSGIITGVLTILGVFLDLFELGKEGIFPWIINNFIYFWLSSITLFLTLLAIWIIKFKNRFIGTFKDNFDSDFRKNWDYIGPWRTTEENFLVVTGSDEGGITKQGAFWENYNYSFKCKILNRCIGVIIRAQDLNNYYMFQICKDKIIPHRRTSVPVIEDTENMDKKSINVSYRVGWVIMEEKSIEHGQDLNNWFSCTIITKGESLVIKLNDEIVYQEESFLKIPYGKVGFRNWYKEKALISKVRVSLNI
jgi:hypothetical protein